MVKVNCDTVKVTCDTVKESWQNKVGAIDEKVSGCHCNAHQQVYTSTNVKNIREEPVFSLTWNSWHNNISTI